MIEIKVIRIVNDEGVIKTCFVDMGKKKLIFESERTLRDKYNEATAFEMGFSYGMGFSGLNFSIPREHMTQEEFNKLELDESPWCGTGPRTQRKKEL